MKTIPANTIPQEHLFTVRGRPVMFRKDEMFFGALHATERGYFPASSTGFYSLAQFTLHARDGAGFLDLVSGNFLESLAAEQQRRTNEVQREIKECANRNPVGEDTAYAFIHCSHCAAQAFEHGSFATDAMRRELWQAAHETYSNLSDSPYARHAPKNHETSRRRIDADRQIFETLRRCMAGDFSIDKNSIERTAFCMSAYLDLPSRLDGEPIITSPSRTLAFDFGD